MCGIAGIVGNRDSSLIERMTQALYHRGPDSAGYFRSPDLDIGMRRLSIIDLSSGDQPIYNETRDKCIVFNGEIYNYRELRRELLGKGHHFDTATDTEVIIHLYEEYAEQCVIRLRGMFAFAIADGNRLFIARDRIGIKPLYYAHLEDRGLFLFASEIKALLQCPDMSAALDRHTMTDYLIAGHALGDETFFEGIKSLQPGHSMLLTRQPDGIEILDWEYWSLSVEPDESMTFEESEEVLGQVLRDSVESHLIADVAVGLTLSGGVDSSLLALLAKDRRSDRMSTFTVSDDRASPDIKQSRMMANHIGSAHTEVLPAFEDYIRSIPFSVLAAEAPANLIGLPFFILCREIGRRFKVCLNGEGSDEVFGGYPDYLDADLPLARLRDGVAKAGRLGLVPGDYATDLIEKLSTTDKNEYLKRFFVANLQDQLTRRHLEIVDKHSMAWSVEMRVPFLDNDLVDFANRLPVRFKVNRQLGIGKYILKRVALSLFGDAMSDAVLRRKIGLPSAGVNYFSRFADLCDANLPDSYLDKHQMGEYFLVKNSGGRRVARCELLLLDLFCFIFMEHRGSVPDGFTIEDFILQKSSKRELTAFR